jgi:hypothetical protein
MPRKPIEYNKTNFYKIVCKDLQLTDCYVGHTTNFATRKANHKYYAKNENTKEHKLHLYQHIKNHGGWDNFDMILIETRSCMNRLEACKIEREHIEQLGAMLNCRRPMISKEEKLEYSRTYALANCKEYYRENREAILLQKKRYYENTKLSNQLKKEAA